MNLTRSFQKRVHKIRSLVIDPENLFLTEEKLRQGLQRDPGADYLEDRNREVMDFFGIDREELDRQIQVYKDYEATEEDMAINPAFDLDKNLFDYYRNKNLEAAVGHMSFDIPYYRTSFKLIQYLNSFYPRANRSRITVMDYGCGTAEYGLAFATQGYRARLVDLQGGPIDFASWRLAQRNLPHDTLAISEDDPYPDLGVNHIVLAPEVLEHIRNPVRLLENMYDSIPKGGFFWTSGFPVVPREVGADHLPEAAELRPKALAFLEENYTRVHTPPLPGFLYRKG